MAKSDTTTETGGVNPQSKESIFSRYKSDQGTYARQTAFWVLLLIGFYGFYQLKGTLDGSYPGMREGLIEGELPILGSTLSSSLILCTVLFVIYFVWLWWFLNRPKSADLLIETEGELKKVTWPSSTETVNSSLVVIGTVVLLLAYTSLVDFLLGSDQIGIINWLLYSKGS